MNPTVVAWLDRTPKVEGFIEKNRLTPLWPPTRKAIVAQLRILEEGPNNKIYQVPSGINGPLFIRCAEQQLFSGLSSRVVCGLRGKALRPYYQVYREKASFRGIQAVFSIPQAVMAITATFGGLIKIEKYQLSRTRDTVTLQEIPCWEGEPGSLPSVFQHLRKAVEAAWLKIQSDNPTAVFYAQTQAA